MNFLAGERPPRLVIGNSGVALSANALASPWTAGPAVVVEVCGQDPHAIADGKKVARVSDVGEAQAGLSIRPEREIIPEQPIAQW